MQLYITEPNCYVLDLYTDLSCMGLNLNFRLLVVQC